MLTLEEKIARSERFAKLCGQAEIPEWQEECEQLAAWLRELKERRKQPEIVRCGECANQYKPTCPFGVWINTPDDGHCHWAERRTNG
jgi:hypothetical protein